MLLFAPACENQLEIPNPNDLSADQFYATEEQAIAAVDGTYNALIIDGAYNRMTPSFNDGRSDEVGARSPWILYSGVSSFVVPATIVEVGFVWNAHYIMVLRANQALENITNIPDMDPELLRRLEGQAYFLRALAYFNLTNTYNIVPLILEVPEDQESFYPSNEGVTKDMIWDQIQSDLEAAIDNRLPVSYNDVTGPDNGQVGRATLGAALSLLGKVNLYRERYEEAGEYFQRVIDLRVYALAPNYADLFSQDPAVEQSNPGRIFWSEFTTSTNATLNWGGDPNANWRQFLAVSATYAPPGYGFFDFYPTPFLYNEMRQELTVEGTIDPRFYSTILSYAPEAGYTTAYGDDWFATTGGRGPYDSSAYFIKKYTNASNGTTPDNAFTSGINYHILRYADVLLMYAECLANAGDIATAAQYVQQVRSRANLPDRTAEFAGYSLDQFMDQLSHERVMELAIEGTRWHDIRRWGWLENPTKLEELAAHDAEFETYEPDRQWIPIAQDELDRNGNLVGNSANR